MSGFNYERVDKLMEKLHEFGDFLDNRRVKLGKKFGYDLKQTTMSEGKEAAIYDVMYRKLAEILTLKEQLPPEAHDLLLMTFGSNTRFEEWMAKQEKAERYAELHDIHQALIHQTPTHSDASGIAEFMDLHRNAYLSLKKIILYLNRIEHSERTDDFSKQMAISQKAQILRLASLLNKLQLETKLTASDEKEFIEKLTALFRSKEFRGFFSYAQQFYFDPIVTTAHHVSGNSRFHWHFPDKFNIAHLRDCIIKADLCKQYEQHSQSLSPHTNITRLLLSPGPHDLLIAYDEKHAGHVFMGTKLSAKRINPHRFIIDLDTEFPCDGLGKTKASRDDHLQNFTAYRAGLIEEALMHLNPEKFMYNDNGFNSGSIPKAILGMGADDILNPLAFDGKWLLNHMRGSLEYLMLAAISPVTPKGEGEVYTPDDFSPADKLKAYALLIQAIDEKKIRIADIDVSVLDQKRKIAERALYVMVKHNIPHTNPDFVAIKDSIESGSGIKALKKLGKLLRKPAETVEGKTIQKLFREYSEEQNTFTLKQLRSRIQHPTDYPTAGDYPEPTGRARVVYAAAGAGAGAGGSEMEGYRAPEHLEPSAGGGASAGPLDFRFDLEGTGTVSLAPSPLTTAGGASAGALDPDSPAGGEPAREAKKVVLKEISSFQLKRLKKPTDVPKQAAFFSRLRNEQGYSSSEESSFSDEESPKPKKPGND